MKQLQAGDKIVRQMTREGAVELNKATGGAESISVRDYPGVSAGSKKSYPPYSSGNPPAKNVQNSGDNSSEKGGSDSFYVLGGVVDRVQMERAAAKKRIHRKANLEIYKRSQPKPELSKLKFTDAELADPSMSKAIGKSQKAIAKYEKAQGKIPKEKYLTFKRVSEPSGKTKTRLSFGERNKPPNGKLIHALDHLDRPAQETGLC